MLHKNWFDDEEEDDDVDDWIDINSIDWYGKLREKEKTKLSVVGIQFSPETTRLPENDGQLSISDRHSPERK